jgi:predicted transcriptional regulator
MPDANDISSRTYKVPAVEQAIRIMLCLVDSGNNPKSLTDICSEVSIHRSKAFSILNTLDEYGFIGARAAYTHREDAGNFKSPAPC